MFVKKIPNTFVLVKDYDENALNIFENPFIAFPKTSPQCLAIFNSQALLPLFRPIKTVIKLVTNITNEEPHFNFYGLLAGGISRGSNQQFAIQYPTNEIHYGLIGL